MPVTLNLLSDPSLILFTLMGFARDCLNPNSDVLNVTVSMRMEYLLFIFRPSSLAKLKVRSVDESMLAVERSESPMLLRVLYFASSTVIV